MWVLYASYLFWFYFVQSAHFFTLQTEEFAALEEGDEGAASQSVSVDQEVTLSQSETADPLEQEVIVIVTDTESEDDQEEEEEEEEEQVGGYMWNILKGSVEGGVEV